MGGGASVAKSISTEWMDIFRAMKLRTWEVQKLYDIYNTVDADRSGSIDVVELLMFLDIERTMFTERIFEAFDKDHTHRVDFYEFVVSVWKFCILSNEAACVFAFDLYDKNAKGRLAVKEVTEMFREILGTKALEQEHTQRVLHKLLAEADFGFVSSDTWRRFAKLHQALLTNVFGIQNKLRITTLGVRFWEKVSKRRIQIRPGCVVPLSDLMALHSHRKVFTDIKDNQSAVLRVSSMMRIVLDNTDSAVHQKTPPASPAKNQRTFKILNPFFPSYDATRAHEPPASANSSVASPVVSPRGAGGGAAAGQSRAQSPPGSPDTALGSAQHRRGTAGSVGSGGDASHASSAGPHHKSDKESHQQHHHDHHHELHDGHAQTHPKPAAHHGHGRHSPALAVVLHKQQRPVTADLKLVHMEKDILVG